MGSHVEINKVKEEKNMGNSSVAKVTDRIATLKVGDFLILSEIRNYTPNREYKVNVLFYTEQGFVPQRIRMEVTHMTQSEPMNCVITREGSVGYILNITDDAGEGPQLPDWNKKRKKHCEKHETSLNNNEDFVMFAGVQVKPGDYVKSIYPSWKELLKENINEKLGRRILDVMYVMTSENKEKGKVSLVKGFTVKSVETEGKHQRIHTNDGRTGINLISYNGGRSYQKDPIN